METMRLRTILATFNIALRELYYAAIKIISMNIQRSIFIFPSQFFLWRLKFHEKHFLSLTLADRWSIFDRGNFVIFPTNGEAHGQY